MWPPAVSSNANRAEAANVEKMAKNKIMAGMASVCRILDVVIIVDLNLGIATYKVTIFTHHCQAALSAYGRNRN
jgi:hypothetical protein